MKQTFRVYNECVTRITIDVPEDATVNEVEDMIADAYYSGAYPSEEIPEITDIEGVEENRGLDEDLLLKRNGQERYFSVSEKKDRVPVSVMEKNPKINVSPKIFITGKDSELFKRWAEKHKIKKDDDYARL